MHTALGMNFSNMDVNFWTRPTAIRFGDLTWKYHHKLRPWFLLRWHDDGGFPAATTLETCRLFLSLGTNGVPIAGPTKPRDRGTLRLTVWKLFWRCGLGVSESAKNKAESEESRGLSLEINDTVDGEVGLNLDWRCTVGVVWCAIF